jgi:hypothetical protein
MSGTVKSVSFAQGQPEITIQTATGETIANVSMASISQVR